jgi:hypothetical protein
MKPNDPASSPTNKNSEQVSDSAIERYRNTHGFLTELARRFNSALPKELSEFARDPFEPLEELWDDGWDTFWHNWFLHGFQPYWASQEISDLPDGLNPFTSLSSSALAYAAPHQAGNYEHRLGRLLNETPFTFWQVTAIESPMLCTATSVYFDLTVELQENTEQLSVGDIIFARVITPKDLLDREVNSEQYDRQDLDNEHADEQRHSVIAGCAPVLFQPENIEDLKRLQSNLLQLANECSDPETQLDHLSYEDQRKYDFFLMDLFSELTATLLQPKISMNPDSLAPILLTYTAPKATLEILHCLDSIRDAQAPVKEDSHGVREVLLRTDSGHPIPAKVLGSEMQILALSQEIADWIHQQLMDLFECQIQLQNTRKLQQHEFEITRTKKDPRQAANS